MSTLPSSMCKTCGKVLFYHGDQWKHTKGSICSMIVPEVATSPIDDKIDSMAGVRDVGMKIDVTVKIDVSYNKDPISGLEIIQRDEIRQSLNNIENHYKTEVLNYLLFQQAQVETLGANDNGKES